MSLQRRVPALLLVSLLAVGALTACGEELPVTSAPTKSAPSASPTDIADASDEPDAAAISAIVIDKDSVSVTISEGGTLVDIPFTTDPTTAAAQLSEAIGLDPITSVTPPASCGGDMTKVSWGGISFWTPYASAPPGAQFYAAADAKETSNGITVTMTGGQWVGFDGPSTIAAYPGAELGFGMESLGTRVLAYDIASGSDGADVDSFWGGIAVIQDGFVHQFSSPIHYWYDC